MAELTKAKIDELCRRLDELTPRVRKEACDPNCELDNLASELADKADEAATLIRRLERERDEAREYGGEARIRENAERAKFEEIRGRATTAEAEAESWKSQFHSAAEAASMYVEFYEQHHADFDPAGNYIPHSQIDGDLRAAEAEAERLRAENTDLSHREKVRSEAINKALHDANERAESAQARADLANKLFDQREEYLAGLDARNSELRADNERLREALKPFADRASRYDPDENDNNEPDWCTAAPSIRIGDLRRARTALEGKTDER